MNVKRSFKDRSMFLQTGGGGKGVRQNQQQLQTQHHQPPSQQNSQSQHKSVQQQHNSQHQTVANNPYQATTANAATTTHHQPLGGATILTNSAYNTNNNNNHSAQQQHQQQNSSGLFITSQPQHLQQQQSSQHRPPSHQTQASLQQLSSAAQYSTLSPYYATYLNPLTAVPTSTVSLQQNSQQQQPHTATTAQYTSLNIGGIQQASNDVPSSTATSTSSNTAGGNSSSGNLHGNVGTSTGIMCPPPFASGSSGGTPGLISLPQYPGNGNPGLLPPPAASAAFVTAAQYYPQYPLQSAVMAAAAYTNVSHATTATNNTGNNGGTNGATGFYQQSAQQHQSQQQSLQQTTQMHYYQPTAAAAAAAAISGASTSAPPHLHPNHPQIRNLMSAAAHQRHQAPATYLLQANAGTLFTLPSSSLGAPHNSLMANSGALPQTAGTTTVAPILASGRNPTGGGPTAYIPSPYCQPPLPMGPTAMLAPTTALAASPIHTYGPLPPTLGMATPAVSHNHSELTKRRTHAIPIIDPITKENILNPKQQKSDTSATKETADAKQQQSTSPSNLSKEEDIRETSEVISKDVAAESNKLSDGKSSEEDASSTSSRTTITAKSSASSCAEKPQQKMDDKSITVKISTAPPQQQQQQQQQPPLSATTSSARTFSYEKIDQQMQTESAVRRNNNNIAKGTTTSNESVELEKEKNPTKNDYVFKKNLEEAQPCLDKTSDKATTTTASAILEAVSSTDKVASAGVTTSTTKDEGLRETTVGAAATVVAAKTADQQNLRKNDGFKFPTTTSTATSTSIKRDIRDREITTTMTSKQSSSTQGPPSNLVTIYKRDGAQYNSNETENNIVSLHQYHPPPGLPPPPQHQSQQSRQPRQQSMYQQQNKSQDDANSTSSEPPRFRSQMSGGAGSASGGTGSGGYATRQNKFQDLPFQQKVKPQTYKSSNLNYSETSSSSVTVATSTTAPSYEENCPTTVSSASWTTRAAGHQHHQYQHQAPGQQSQQHYQGGAQAHQYQHQKQRHPYHQQQTQQKHQQQQQHYQPKQHGHMMQSSQHGTDAVAPTASSSGASSSTASTPTHMSKGSSSGFERVFESLEAESGGSGSMMDAGASDGGASSIGKRNRKQNNKRVKDKRKQQQQNQHQDVDMSMRPPSSNSAQNRNRQSNVNSNNTSNAVQTPSMFMKQTDLNLSGNNVNLVNNNNSNNNVSGNIRILLRNNNNNNSNVTANATQQHHNQQQQQHQQQQQAQQQQQQYFQKPGGGGRHSNNNNNSSSYNDCNRNMATTTTVAGALDKNIGDKSVQQQNQQAVRKTSNPNEATMAATDSTRGSITSSRSNYSSENNSPVSSQRSSPGRHMKTHEIVSQYLRPKTSKHVTDSGSDRTTTSDEVPLQFLHSSSCEEDDDNPILSEDSSRHIYLDDVQSLTFVGIHDKLDIDGLENCTETDELTSLKTEGSNDYAFTEACDDVAMEQTQKQPQELAQRRKKNPFADNADTVDFIPSQSPSTIDVFNDNTKYPMYKQHQQRHQHQPYHQFQNQQIGFSNEAHGSIGGSSNMQFGQSTASVPVMPPQHNSTPNLKANQAASKDSDSFIRYSLVELRTLSNSSESQKPPMVPCQKGDCVSQLFVSPMQRLQQHGTQQLHHGPPSGVQTVPMHYQAMNFNEATDFGSMGKRRADRQQKKHHDHGNVGVSASNLGPGNAAQQRKADIIHVHLSLHEEIKLSECENAWMPDTLRNVTSSKAPEQKPTEEEANNDDLEIVLKKVRGVLNKLTPDNFDVLLKTMSNISMNTQEKIQQVMLLIFEKTVSEPNFAPTYAKFCKMLFQEIKAENKSMFSTSLISRIQHEFETNVNDADAKQLKLKPLIEKLEASTDAKERLELQAELEDQEYQFRRRAWGTVRFIGEMYKQQSITGDRVLLCVESLLEHGSEEKLEYMCKLLTTVGHLLEGTGSSQPQLANYIDRMDKIFRRIHDIVHKYRGGFAGNSGSGSGGKHNKGSKHQQRHQQNQQQLQEEAIKISNRVRFMMQDVIDLRSNSWRSATIATPSELSQSSAMSSSQSQQQHSQTQQQMSVQQQLSQQHGHRRVRDDKYQSGGSSGGGSSAGGYEKNSNRQYNNQMGSGGSGNRQMRSTSIDNYAMNKMQKYHHQQQEQQLQQQQQQLDQQSEVNIDPNKLKFLHNHSVTPSMTQLGSQSLYLWRGSGRPSGSDSSADTTMNSSVGNKIMNIQKHSFGSVVNVTDGGRRQSERHGIHRQGSNKYAALSNTSPPRSSQDENTPTEAGGSQYSTSDNDDDRDIYDDDDEEATYTTKECQQVLNRIIEEMFDVTSGDAAWQEQALDAWTTANARQQSDVLHYVLMDYLHLRDVKQTQREACAKIFKYLMRLPDMFDKRVFERAYALFSKDFPDLLVDVPNGWNYVFEFLGPIMHERLLDFGDVWLPQWADDSDFTERFLKAMLNYFSSEHGTAYMQELWHTHYRLDRGQNFMQDDSLWQRFIASNGYEYLYEMKTAAIAATTTAKAVTTTSTTITSTTPARVATATPTPSTSKMASSSAKSSSAAATTSTSNSYNNSNSGNNNNNKRKEHSVNNVGGVNNASGRSRNNNKSTGSNLK